jgi:hypothetical protein
LFFVDNDCAHLFSYQRTLVNDIVGLQSANYRAVRQMKLMSLQSTCQSRIRDRALYFTYQLLSRLKEGSIDCPEEIRAAKIRGRDSFPLAITLNQKYRKPPNRVD